MLTSHQSYSNIRFNVIVFHCPFSTPCSGQKSSIALLVHHARLPRSGDVHGHKNVSSKTLRYDTTFGQISISVGCDCQRTWICSSSVWIIGETTNEVCLLKEKFNIGQSSPCLLRGDGGEAPHSRGFLISSCGMSQISSFERAAVEFFLGYGKGLVLGY